MFYVNCSMFHVSRFRSQKGVSLYFTITILSLLLGIALAGSSLLIGQLGRLKSSGNSALAFSAADAGIERALYIDNKNCATSPSVAARITCVQTGIDGLTAGDKTLANGASFTLEVAAGGSGFCPAGKNYCVRSKGVFQTATRTLRISR